MVRALRPNFGPLPEGFWGAVFGDDKPVAIEIGAGLGEFLAREAARNSDRNHLGIERSHGRAMAAQRRLRAAALANARVLCGDAACVIEILPDACVAAYFILFPDPWWKRRHHRRRIWTPAFAAALRRTLAVGGTVEFWTDVPETFALGQRMLATEALLQPVEDGEYTAEATTFARKARRRGAKVRRSVHLRGT